LDVIGNEDLVNLFSGFIVRRSGDHHGEELREIDLSTAVLVDLSDHLVNGLGLGLNTERIDGNFEFYIKKALHLGSIAPPRSRSNKSNAFLISITSSTVT